MLGSLGVQPLASGIEGPSQDSVTARICMLDDSVKLCTVSCILFRIDLALNVAILTEFDALLFVGHFRHDLDLTRRPTRHLGCGSAPPSLSSRSLHVLVFKTFTTEITFDSPSFEDARWKFHGRAVNWPRPKIPGL